MSDIFETGRVFNTTNQVDCGDGWRLLPFITSQGAYCEISRHGYFKEVTRFYKTMKLAIIVGKRRVRHLRD